MKLHTPPVAGRGAPGCEITGANSVLRLLPEPPLPALLLASVLGLGMLSGGARR